MNVFFFSLKLQVIALNDKLVYINIVWSLFLIINSNITSR